MKAVAAPSNCSIEWLFLVRSVPRYIRSDNGPELANTLVLLFR